VRTGRYIPEVDNFTLIGIEAETPSVKFVSERHLHERLGVSNRPAATILVQLADSWVDKSSPAPNDAITIESDMRAEDLTRAIDIITAARDELLRLGEHG
jgi:hypothetical protein